MLRKKLRVLSSLFEDIQDKVDRVLEGLKAIEESLANRHMFRSEEHFCKAVNNSGPACHCRYYAFGRIDPVEMLPGEDDRVKMSCGHYHRGGCVLCDQIDSFLALLDDLGANATASVKAKLLEFNIKYHKQRYLHYRGHQARLAHEGQVSSHIKRKLREDMTLIAITADYAMKFLPLKDSEAQNEFFGEAGINWHGICIMWYDSVKGQFLQYYVNQCVEDFAEEGISVRHTG